MWRRRPKESEVKKISIGVLVATANLVALHLYGYHWDRFVGDASLYGTAVH